MKTTIIHAGAALAAIALAGAVWAQAPAGDPGGVQAGTYSVEPQHTRILFSVLHLGFTHYYGDFTGASGTLTLDPKNVGAAQVNVTFPTTSVSTTNPKLDGELKDVPWLDANAFPKATFVSRKVTQTGPKTARIEGDLTLRGVTKPVVLEASFNAAGMNPLTHKYTVGFDAVGHLNRSDFNVKAFVPAISDNVDIIISAAFEKQG